MNYRPKILFIFSSLLGLIFYGTIGIANTQNVTATAQSKSTAPARKTNSNNIHIDDIAIKISSDTQPGNSVISDEEHKMLALKLSNDAQEDFISWCKRQGLIIALFGLVLIIAVLKLIWDSIENAIEKSVKELVKEEMARSNRLIDSAVSGLVDKKTDIVVATNKTIEATTNANTEIERTKIALNELQEIEKELDKKLKDCRCEIDKEVKNTALIKIDLDLAKLESEERTTGEISELENKIKYLKLIINEIDKDEVAENNVVDELLINLNSNDKEPKYTAAELLPLFEIKSNNETKDSTAELLQSNRVEKSNKIANAFVDTLKKTEDKALGSILLGGLGKLRCNDEVLEYLFELLDNKTLNKLNDTYILFIIGTLGELGEIGKDKIKDTALESIINKLLLILNTDLDNKEFASDITASQVRSAIAVALSWYGKKAANAENDVIKLLEDQEPETRKNAAIAIEKIGSKNAITALENLTNDESILVSKAAKKAIEELKKL